MDDLISRQELLKRTIYNPLHGPYIITQDVLDCPSAQHRDYCYLDSPCPYQNEENKVTERKKGHWIKKERNRGGLRRYTGIDEYGETHTITVDERTCGDDHYCSECGKLCSDVSLNFCSYCGADMRGDEDG